MSSSRILCQLCRKRRAKKSVRVRGGGGTARICGVCARNLDKDTVAR